MVGYKVSVLGVREVNFYSYQQAMEYFYDTLCTTNYACKLEKICYDCDINRVSSVVLYCGYTDEDGEHINSVQDTVLTASK